MPVLLGGAWLLGVALAVTGKALWWLLRVLWAVLWRVLAVAAALLVVAFSRSLAWKLAAAALSAALSGNVVRHLGGRGVLGLSGQRRTTPTGLVSTAPPVVKLKPVSAQKVATASFKATRFFTEAMDGPELLSMCVGPSGAGKSEVVWGSLRAGLDGVDFCGLKTTRARRVLLLSEQGGAVLQPSLRRWGFYAEPAGRLDAVRLRLLPARGAGSLIDVLYSADVYKPIMVDGELRQVAWDAVIEAIRPLVEKGRYDRVIVDSLGEWLGADNNDNMLKTLAACRQLTHAGAGVTLLHHTPRSDPKRPRGGTVIEAKLDILYAVTGTGTGAMPRSRQDPVRALEWPGKTRFPDLTPPGALRIERVLGDARPRYALEGAPGNRVLTDTINRAEGGDVRPGSLHPSDPDSAPSSTLTTNEEKVLTAMQAAGRLGATTKALGEAAGIPRQRAHEAVLGLIRRSKAREGGYAETPGGGPKASLYVALTPSPRGVSEPQRPALRLVPALDRNRSPEPEPLGDNEDRPDRNRSPDPGEVA